MPPPRPPPRRPEGLCHAEALDSNSRARAAPHFRQLRAAGRAYALRTRSTPNLAYVRAQSDSFASASLFALFALGASYVLEHFEHFENRGPAVDSPKVAPRACVARRLASHSAGYAGTNVLFCATSAIASILPLASHECRRAIHGRHYAASSGCPVCRRGDPRLGVTIATASRPGRVPTHGRGLSMQLWNVAGWPEELCIGRKGGRLQNSFERIVRYDRGKELGDSQPFGRRRRPCCAESEENPNTSALAEMVPQACPCDRPWDVWILSGRLTLGLGFLLPRLLSSAFAPVQSMALDCPRERTRLSRMSGALVLRGPRFPAVTRFALQDTILCLMRRHRLSR